jgi:hypothetical protein
MGHRAFQLVLERSAIWRIYAVYVSSEVSAVPLPNEPVAVRLQYKDPDEAFGACSFIRYLQVFL